MWSFGTAARSASDLPADYEVRADGDTLTASRDGNVTHLTSGQIADPTHWLALVSANRATAMVTASRNVPLSGGTVDLQVRSWADDAAWGDRTVDLLAGALPRLEKAIGLRYQRQGPLVVVEALPQAGGLGEAAPDAQDLQIAFDQPPFTVLHQAAHVWLGESFASDRWIREGLASHYAAIVARELKVALPYDPAKRAIDLKSAALPLADWPTDATADQDTWAYAASWAEVDGLAAAVGEDKLRLALQRVGAGQSAYDANAATPLVAPVTSGGLVPAVDSRRLLDQLEITSGITLTDEFAANVFAPDVKDELAARTEARTAYAVLLAAAGDWGAPDPVRASMAGWNFDDATNADERGPRLARRSRRSAACCRRSRPVEPASAAGPLSDERRRHRCARGAERRARGRLGLRLNARRGECRSRRRGAHRTARRTGTGRHAGLGQRAVRGREPARRGRGHL